VGRDETALAQRLHEVELSHFGRDTAKEKLLRVAASLKTLAVEGGSK
jgi:hypothetical protein